MQPIEVRDPEPMHWCLLTCSKWLKWFMDQLVRSIHLMFCFIFSAFFSCFWSWSVMSWSILLCSRISACTSVSLVSCQYMQPTPVRSSLTYLPRRHSSSLAMEVVWITEMDSCEAWGVAVLCCVSMCFIFPRQAVFRTMFGCHLPHRTLRGGTYYQRMQSLVTQLAKVLSSQSLPLFWSQACHQHIPTWWCPNES